MTPEGGLSIFGPSVVGGAIILVPTYHRLSRGREHCCGKKGTTTHADKDKDKDRGRRWPMREMVKKSTTDSRLIRQ